ncbi:MAG TPA: site-2 protease family protein, partial [Candidatus Limnocylindrales bacterium]|nr:site-2 protease family protein [Candidatus Limnocylindrales bacterium]
MSGLPVARLFGFEIRLHLSWVVILAVVTLVVATQLVVPEPGWASWVPWAIGAASAAGLLGSILVHELAHGLVARRRGITTSGLTLYFFGGSASLELEADRPGDEAAIAIAGPLASLGLAVAAVVVAQAATAVGPLLGPVADTALVLAGLNALVGLMNLVPAYPFDGGRVVRAVAWARTGDEATGSRVAGIAGRA